MNGCQTGDAKISPAFNLSCQYVIHTVGPVWHGGNRGEATQLARCYQRSLALAVQKNLTSIAFPAISTGVYGYPLEPATEIAIDTVRDFVLRHFKQADDLSLCDVIFCCFSYKDAAVYKRLLAHV